MPPHVRAALLVLGAADPTSATLAAGTVFDWLQTSLAITFLALLIMGILIPSKTVESRIVAPLQSRIDALERANEEKDRQNNALIQQMAAALKTQSDLLEQALSELRRQTGRG